MGPIHLHLLSFVILPTLPSPTLALMVLSRSQFPLVLPKPINLKCVEPTLELKEWVQSLHLLSVSFKHSFICKFTCYNHYSLLPFSAPAAICVGSLHYCTRYSSLSIYNYWVQFGLYSGINLWIFQLIRNLNINFSCHVKIIFQQSEIWSILTPYETKNIDAGPEKNMLDHTCDIL